DASGSVATGSSWSLAVGPDADEPEPDAAAPLPERRAVRRVAEHGEVGPAAALVRRLRGFAAAVTPLTHGAVHVVQPDPVRLVGPDLYGTPQIRRPQSRGQGLVLAVEVGEGWRDLVGRFVEVVEERALRLCRRAAAAGVLPLRLRRQAVRPARRAFLLAQPPG